MPDISNMMGGDTPLANSMMAGQAAMGASAIVKADPNAVKFSMDAFTSAIKGLPGKMNGQTLQTIKASTASNTVIADAIQQQSMWTRLASKIPFVKNWLG